jgi:hypothetical protein
MESDEEEILDTRWLTNFKNAEAKYTPFYKEPITSIRLYVLYIKEKEIIHREIDRCSLDPQNSLKRERIMKYIKYYQEHEATHYKLKSLLRYNIDLNPEEVGDFVNGAAVNDRFLTSEKYLDDIHFNDSITMFHKLNALYFIFFAEPIQPVNHTRRIVLAKAKTHKTKRNNHIKISKEIG